VLNGWARHPENVHVNSDGGMPPAPDPFPAWESSAELAPSPVWYDDGGGCCCCCSGGNGPRGVICTFFPSAGLTTMASGCGSCSGPPTRPPLALREGRCRLLPPPPMSFEGRLRVYEWCATGGPL
jgi:hypothetical protein